MNHHLSLFFIFLLFALAIGLFTLWCIFTFAAQNDSNPAPKEFCEPQTDTKFDLCSPPPHELVEVNTGARAVPPSVVMVYRSRWNSARATMEALSPIPLTHYCLLHGGPENILGSYSSKSPTTPKSNDMIKEPSELIDQLREEGGAIVSSGDCSEMEIADARATGRFAADEFGYGYVRRTKEWLALQLAREKAQTNTDEMPWILWAERQS
jgi:hypothetical protein